MSEHAQSAGMACLCFSKDRPFQLDGYIRSMRRFLKYPVSLTVLYKATDPDILEGYECLKREHPEVSFVQESDFGAQTLRWLAGVETPLVFFGCDDVVFYQPVDMALVEAVLREHPSVLGFSLRLGLNIRHTHTHEDVVPHPAFITESPVLRWVWRGRPSDWGYPFEVNGTIYRTAFIRTLFQSLEKIRASVPQAEWRHPNHLEYSGNQVLIHTAQTPGELAAFPKSCLVVPTVNQVQNIAWNHLLGEIRTVRELEALRRSGDRMDLDAYAATSFDRIHVPEFFTEKQEAHANA